MKRKSVIFISLIMAGVMLLCSCNSGDGKESSYGFDFSYPSGNNSASAPGTYSEEEQHSNGLTLSGVYYASLYEEDTPMRSILNVNTACPIVIDFTSETRAKFTFDNSPVVIKYNYSIENGKFNASTVTKYTYGYSPISYDFTASGDEFYLTWDIEIITYQNGKGEVIPQKYKVKYAHQNILEGKYELVGKPNYSNSCVALEFNGDEMTITKYNGEVEKFYYEISGQKLSYKKNKDDGGSYSFYMYGYNKDHLFTSINHTSAMRDYDEFKRVN